MLAGEVTAVEINEGRARELEENARRLGASNVRVVVADGRALPAELTAFDHALVDAPCSGLGVLNRRPDLRWRAEPLPELQLELLRAAAERSARAARSSTRSARSTPTSPKTSSVLPASRWTRASPTSGPDSGTRAAPSSCRPFRTSTTPPASSSRGCGARSRGEDPARCLDAPFRPARTRVPRPGNCVRDTPAAGSLAVDAELAECIEPAPNGRSRVRIPKETDAVDLALAHQRLGVDDEPRLALRAEHVPPVQILVHEPPCRRIHRQIDVERDIDQRLVEGSARRDVPSRNLRRPALRLRRERPERMRLDRQLAEPEEGSDTTATSSVSESASSVPGRQRSHTNARRPSSRATSRTAPCPPQRARASASWSASKCEGALSFNTTSPAGTTSE